MEVFTKPNKVPGGCDYVAGETRLGSAWYLCNDTASHHCVISHGGEEEEVDYCLRHYAAAKRRTRYDKLISAEKI